MPRRSWDSELSEHLIQCLESYWLDQAVVSSTSAGVGYEYERATHYPSTPASKALRLSSKVDIPVRIKMRVFSPLGFVDSILRISFVAPTPSSSGIDISRRTILMLSISARNRERQTHQERTRIDLQSRTSVRHHVRQRLQLHHIPNIKRTRSVVT